MGKTKKAVCIMLAAGLICSSVAGNYAANAAKKAVLKSKSISMNVGEKKKIKIAGKRKNAVYKYVSAKKAVASVSKKGVITAKKAGKVKITVSEKIAKKTRKLGKVKVTVNKVQPQQPQASNQPLQPQPAVTAPVVSTPEPTVKPTEVPTEAPTPTAEIIKAEHADIENTLPSDYMAKQDGIRCTYEKITYYSEVTESDRVADVFLPPNYDPDKKYPVLYMLHGIGLGGSRFGQSKDADISVITANAITSGKAKEMIIVAPNCRCSDDPETDTHSAANYALYDLCIDDITGSLMPYMEENYNILTGRENTCVAGWSMGGREALYVGMSHPELFGYIAAFCPAPGLFEYVNPDVGAGESGLFTEETFTLSEEYKNNTYIFILRGIYDNVVNEHPVLYHQALEANGVPHTYWENGVGHSWETGFYNFIKNVFVLEDEKL